MSLPASSATASGAPRLAVIILNYRTADLVIECLASFVPELPTWPGLEAVVVDNASGDGSDERIERALAERGWSGWARLVRSPDNGGFAAGNNLGIRSAAADVYWLLNSDTLLLPGALAELRRALRARPDAGLISTGLEWPDGSRRVNCFRFMRPPTELVRAAATGLITRLLRGFEPAMPIPDAPAEPEWSCFASILIRQWVFERIGYLDDGYFMYYEDMDFCRRAREAGIALVFWPTARVIHLEGQTSGVAKVRTLGRRPPYFYAARSRYYAKFHGRTGLLRANLCWLLGSAISHLRGVVSRKPPPAHEHEGRDNWINWRDPLNGPSRPPAHCP